MKKEFISKKMEFVVRNLEPSGYSMGDLFTLIVNDIVVKFDKREYYKGRGKKYNRGIRHGNISEIMSVNKLNVECKKIKSRIKKENIILYENRLFDIYKNIIEKYNKVIINPEKFESEDRKVMIEKMPSKHYLKIIC